MTSVFAKVFLDEDVDLIVADIIRSHGFYAVATQDVDRKKSPDDDQFRYAAENGYVILTHNRGDFERLALEYFNENRSHAGIVVSVQRPPKEIARSMIRVLSLYTVDSIKNRIVYI